MSNRMAKVRRADVVACMTCPLCDKLLMEATTISLCLHTFCRKCIFAKLSDDECDTCPVCDINLGGDPVDKLRPDHNLQDIRAKIFPIKRRIDNAPEAAPSVSPPAKRKERSLSSLVVSAPRVSAHAGATGRRTRGAMRKSSTPRGSSPIEEPPRREENLMEDQMDGLSSPETLNKIVQNKKLVHSSKSFNNQNPKEDAGNSSGKVKVEQYGNQDTSIKQNGHRGDGGGETNRVPFGPSAVKRKRRPPNRSTAAASGDLNNSTQVMVDGMRHQRQNVPIWFSLVASEEQEGTAPLPQISSGFLRIKNGDMPVSSIQKYVAKKLELASEDEVEIMCQGQPILPSLELRSLLDKWLRAVPGSRRIKTKVGSSGKDFVMVLTYSRKVRIEAQVEQQPQN